MTRYAIRRRRDLAPRIHADDYDDDFDPPDPPPTIIVTVAEPADDFIDTGLVDESGDAIVRMRERIGFVT